MVPEPSVSKRSKASRISLSCSSVRPVERLPLSGRTDSLRWRKDEREGEGEGQQATKSEFHTASCLPSVECHDRANSTNLAGRERGDERPRGNRRMSGGSPRREETNAAACGLGSQVRARGADAGPEISVNNVCPLQKLGNRCAVCRQDAGSGAPARRPRDATQRETRNPSLRVDDMTVRERIPGPVTLARATSTPVPGGRESR